MDQSNLTVEMVRKELHEIAIAQRDEWQVEDFHYLQYPFARSGQCQYARPDAEGPACLVGHWLHRQGVALNAMVLQENGNADVAILQVLPSVPREVRDYLFEVQCLQDENVGWLTAIDTALPENRE